MAFEAESVTPFLRKECTMPYRKVGVDLGLCGPHHISVSDETGQLVRPPLAVGTSAKELDRIYEHALAGAAEGTQLKIQLSGTQDRSLTQ
jgi:hypothetical protein